MYIFNYDKNLTSFNCDIRNNSYTIGSSDCRDSTNITSKSF